MVIEINGRTVFDSWVVKQAIRSFFCRHDWMHYSHYGLRLRAFADGYEQERLMRSCRKCPKVEFIGYGSTVPFVGNAIPDVPN